MRFTVGERVRFLHESQEGVVQRILDDHRVEVLVDDFLEIEAHQSELVSIHPSERQYLQVDEEEQDTSSPSSKTPAAPSAPPALALAREGDNWVIWLLNHSTEELFFTLYLKYRKRYRSLQSGRVSPRGRTRMAEVGHAELHQAKAIRLQVLHFARGEDAHPSPPTDLEVEIKGDVFAEKAVDIPGLESQGHYFPLRLPEGDTAPSPPSPKKNQEEAPVLNEKAFKGESRVVDLHIEKLIDSPMGLTSEAMLRLQIEKFERELTDAVMNELREIVFIHGIGNGALKREIHHRLGQESYVRSFRLADPMTYGNGATLVLLD